MAVQYTKYSGNLTNSTPVYALVNQESSSSVAKGVYTTAYAEVPAVFLIEKGLLISSPHLKRSARVLQSFPVKVGLDCGEFIATSDISDVYESGETKNLAVLRYLYSLVDELIWFQEQKGSLSRKMLEDFNKLQLYIGLE